LLRVGFSAFPPARSYFIKTHPRGIIVAHTIGQQDATAAARDVEWRRGDRRAVFGVGPILRRLCVRMASVNITVVKRYFLGFFLAPGNGNS